MFLLEQESKYMCRNLTFPRNWCKWKNGLSMQVSSISTDLGLEIQCNVRKKWNRFSARESKRSTTTTTKKDFVPTHMS